ncbi:hypothetical protein [Deinococcus apachensis]|uniref:hypothetical protein n=1 Tax=Deinococcus apachensis TaxID=309886 RepID=UPI0012F85F14|nr:hypothetical protein [Deinococcus apachensis]
MTLQGANVGTPRTMTVGTRSSVKRDGVFYEPTITREGGKVVGDSFVFDPLDSDPEFIFALRLVRDGTTDVSEVCVVRTPGAVAIGQPLAGVYARTVDKEKTPEYFNTYIEDGKTEGLPTCTLTRTR